MEIPTWAASWLLAALALFLLSKYFRHAQNRNLNPAPGPKPWPIIGNLNLIGPLPHLSIHKLSQTYGPIMQLRFGSFPVVIGSSVEMAKIFLKTMDVNFVDRPKTAAGKYTTYNHSDITWAPYGPYWRQGRRIWLTELFSGKQLELYEYIRVEEIKSMLKGLYGSSGKNVGLKDCVSNVTMNVVCRMALGKKYLDDSSEKELLKPGEFKKMLDEILLLNGVINIGDSIPWIDFLDLQGYVKRMKMVSKKFDRFLEHVIDEHITRREKDSDFLAKDMVDLMLKLADDPTLKVKFERHGVKAFTMDLLTAGTDTPSGVVEWAIVELLKKPEIFERATEELDRVVGKNRWVEEKDMPNLPYMQAIVKETMRLHPTVPLLLPREAREDCKVGEYDIVKGTRILVNVWTIGRDPTLWYEPDEFVPERFIGKAMDVKGHDFELLPFGAGRRMCPAYPLGLKMVESCLANLLHGFKWKLPTSMTAQDLDMEEVFGLSTHKKIPLVTVAEHRLPPEVYSL